MMKVIVVALALVMSGCATQRFELQGSGQSSAAYDDAQSFFVSGIGQSKELDAAKVCGGAKNVKSVEMQLTAANVGLTLLTLGIYSPRQMRVHCTR